VTETTTDNKAEEINSPISEPILNHLKMNTTGALLLTGDWGSGKTFHIKKYIFPLIEHSTEFTPIIVSLFGETDKNNIAQKVLFAYFDSKGKNINLGTGTIAKNVKNISDAVPYIKKFVDLEKLILGTGENMFKLIPHDKLFICFDDIERMSEKINVDDFLGIINDLVENKGCKVLLIANETEIKNGISYKEKTIEKTIHFIPNLSNIFDSLVSNYSDGKFKSYLTDNKHLFIETLTIQPEEKEFEKELKKSFSNIRTLKFALEHFKIAFETLIENSEITELHKTQLRNLWIFTLSISIEFRKPNNISLEEKKKLDSQTSTFSDFDFSDFDFSSKDEKEDVAEENDWTYSENFKKKYYNRLSESYIYYDELYVLITSGKRINKGLFTQNVDDSFKVKEGKINPAHQIITSFMQIGYWRYTNEEFAQNLQDLLNYCEQGALEDLISYLNAGVYLIGFSEIIEVEKDTIIEKIKAGLDIFLPKINFNHYIKSQFEMVQTNFTGEHLVKLVTHIKEKIKELDTKKSEEEVTQLQAKFQNNLSDFVKEFLPEHYDIRTPDKPLFHNLALDVVKQGIKNAKPEGIMDLTSLFKIRYLDTSFSERLTDEIIFLTNLENGISEIDFTQKNLSNYLIQNQLNPRITEVKQKLQEYIDTKKTSE